MMTTTKQYCDLSPEEKGQVQEVNRQGLFSDRKLAADCSFVFDDDGELVRIIDTKPFEK